MKKMMIAICLVALVVGGCSAFNQEFSESKEIYLDEPNETFKVIRSYVELPQSSKEIYFVYEDIDGDGKIDEVHEFIYDSFGTFISPRLLILTKEGIQSSF